jgi:hypothetical protein
MPDTAIRKPYLLLILLCLVISPAHAITGGDSVNPSQKTQFETQFNTEPFAKCNVCHKPFESTVVGSRTIPSYSAMTHMGQEAINTGIEHGGHLSSADKSAIYSVIHSSVQPAIEPASAIHTEAEPMKKSGKKAKKTTKKSGKHRKSKKKKLS